MVKSLGLEGHRCDVCGVPLNKDGTHNRSHYTPCDVLTAGEPERAARKPIEQDDPAYWS